MKIEQSHWSPAAGWQHRDGSLEGRPAQFVLAFGGRHLLEDPAHYAGLAARHPGAHIILASTSGEISGSEITEDELTVTAVALERTSVRCAEAAITASRDSRALGAELASRLQGPDLAHVFVISDGSFTNGTELARGLNSNLPAGVLVTGGLAGDGARFERTLVGLNGPPAPGRVVALGFYGKSIRSSFGSSGGWMPFGPERLVTRSDGNRLLELDGCSALALYRQYLGDQAAGLPGTALRFPLSLSPADGSPTVVRTTLSIDEAAQSMTFAGDIPEGARVRFMHASYEDVLDGAAQAAEQTNARAPELVVCISCVGRRLVLGQRTEEELEQVRDYVGPQAVLAGFYSYGELAPAGREAGCLLHNQTMTITAFAEA